ncbi:MAG TPA: ABC transporter transmembrane domain-containing protein [Polyangiaceae bacterium]
MARYDTPLGPDGPRVPPARARALFGRMIALAKPEWRSLALGLVCLAIASSANLVFPQAIRVLVDGALASGAQHAVDQAAMFLFAVGIVSAIAGAARFVLFTVAGERIVARLRRDAYTKLLEQEIAFFDEHKTGDLTSRLASDTTVLQNAVSVNLSMMLRNLASASGGVAMLFVTSWRLTLLMLAVVPAIAFGAVIYGRRVRRLSRDVQDALGHASSVGEESLVGIRTVRAFASEARETERYGDAIEKSFELAKKRNIITGVFFSIAMTASTAAIAVVMGYGGRLVANHEMSVGQLTSFLVYTLVVAFSLGALGDLWADFMRAAGAAERVFEVVDRVPSIPSSGGETPDGVTGRIEIEHVEFAYPTRPDAPVLRSLDLRIEPGQVVAVVGSSGAGKSTIAALLSRLYDPTSGIVRLDGRDLRDLDPQWLRRQVGVVAQEPMLFSSTIAENIRYGKNGATDEEVEHAARVANAHDFVSGFPDKYATRVGERGVQLSGGQKQRIAIARAVLKNPKILVLDEATSALDAESEHLVQEALDRLLEGRTTLVIAHRLSTVKNADRVLVLDAGRVVQQGTHGELVAEAGLYRKLVERQFVAA